MADEEDLLGTMDGLEDDEGEEEEGESGSPLMKYLPLIGGVLVVQIIIGYVIGSLFFASPEEGDETQEPQEMSEEVADVSGIQKEVVYEALEPIVINPAGTGGLRFASVDINLGLSSQAVLAAIEERSLGPRIRDTLINVLASKTIDQLDPRNHEALKTEMREKLNDFLSPNNNPAAVKRVYFQGFVLQ